MAQNTGPEFTRATERAYGIPPGPISRDPEAAAIIATVPEPPEMLTWHYGGDHDDRMTHTGCGGEVFALEDGLICDRCGKQEDN